MHRHLDVRRGTRAEELPSAAVVDILDRGDMEAWKPIAVAIARDPFGAFAAKVLRLIAAYPMYGTSALWRSWIQRCRIRDDSGPARRVIGLSTLRRALGLRQLDLAARLGMSQSDLSKLERRVDARLSTLRAYAKALGGTLRLVFVRRGASIEIRGLGARRRSRAERSGVED